MAWKSSFDGLVFNNRDHVRSFGNRIMKERLAEYHFIDEFGNFYTSEVLTKDIRVTAL
jgi:hypothetical protein